MKTFFFIVTLAFYSSQSIELGDRFSDRSMPFTFEKADSHDIGGSFFDLPFLSNWSDKKHKRHVAFQSWDETTN